MTVLDADCSSSVQDTRSCPNKTKIGLPSVTWTPFGASPGEGRSIKRLCFGPLLTTRRHGSSENRRRRNQSGDVHARTVAGMVEGMVEGMAAGMATGEGSGGRG